MEDSIFQLRHTLHQFPELSGNEKKTSNSINTFIKSNSKAKIIRNIGGYGLAAIFNFANQGPRIMIRCELDALPIDESNDITYASESKGVSHKCGHDGHMAIVAGLALWIEKQKFSKGEIVLLFQPAEENGKGAKFVMEDPKFNDIIPDFIFALHNIPKYKSKSILTFDSAFSAEVQSLVIYLEGKESHASEPEQGKNPSVTISEIISILSKLNVPEPSKSDFQLLTPICLKMGEENYGISPGSAELYYTMRTWTELNLNKLKNICISEIGKICKKHDLGYKLEWIEYFPAATNDNTCNELILSSAKELHLEVIKCIHPFKFGEDFGWLARKYPSAMFGLGAGINTPSLHDSKYDFPDEIIETGIKMFQMIIQKILY